MANKTTTRSVTETSDLLDRIDAMVAEAEAEGFFDEQNEGEGPDPEDEPERRALRAAYSIF